MLVTNTSVNVQNNILMLCYNICQLNNIKIFPPRDLIIWLIKDLIMKKKVKLGGRKNMSEIIRTETRFANAIYAWKTRYYKAITLFWQRIPPTKSGSSLMDPWTLIGLRTWTVSWMTTRYASSTLCFFSLFLGLKLRKANWCISWK